MRNAVKKTNLRFRTREQQRGSNLDRPMGKQSNDGKNPSMQESGIHWDGKSHSDPIIRSRRSRRTRQNRGSALAENPREVEVETSEQHQKGVTSTNREKRDTVLSTLLSKFQELSDRGLNPPSTVSQFWLVVVSLV